MAKMKDEVPQGDVPEVQEYVAAREALENFMDSHSEVFEEYRDMVEHSNDALERADKVVRGKNVSCGPWDKYQTQTKYDAQELYEAMGRDEFLRVGGKVTTKTIYDVDKAKVTASIERGAIPPEVAGEVKKVSPRYKTPKPIGLP